MTTQRAWTSEIPASALNIGAEFGPFYYTLSAEDISAWADHLDPREAAPRSAMPAGMVSVFVLKTAMDAFDGIPYGAILVRWKYEFGEQPKAGAEFQGTLKIVDKEDRKGRSWITFVVQLTHTSTFIASSTVTWIWSR